MTEKYLQPFLSEIRSYCEVVTEFARVLRASQVTAGELGAAAAGLTRVFHTIAGLSSSLEIADFAGLAESLETCLLSISADTSGAASASISGSLADLLDFTTAYLIHRLQVMEISGQ